MKRIKIVGGGLAGLSLGIALQERGVSVTIHERGAYPQHKVCGEFICGVEDQVLTQLGIAQDLADAKIHQRLRWWMDGEQSVDTQLPQIARGISRYILDQRLATRFEQLGGELNLKSRVQTSELGEGVVRASGKQQSGRKEWIGLKIHCYKDNLEGLEMHSGPGGYVGLCDIGGGKINVCGLFQLDSRVSGKAKELILNYLKNAGMGYLSEQLSYLQEDEKSFSATAGFALGQQSREEGFNIGDAQYLIPPFTGNGMSMALESSAQAIEPLIRYAKGDQPWDAAIDSYHQTLKNQFSKRALLARSIHPAIFHPLGRKSLQILAKTNTLPVRSIFTQLRTP